MLTAAKRKYAFVLTAWKLNLAGAMEYRLSFFLTAGMMVLNNVVFVFFWAMYFSRFSVVKGWSITDVMMIWAVFCTGFGVSSTLFGNASRIAYLVSHGELDTYLAQPKPVLLNILVNRMSVTAMGDFLFGLIIYVWFGDHSPAGVLKYLLAVLLTTMFVTFFYLLIQSLAFYVGNAEAMSSQLFMGFISLSTYPTDIFKGWGKILLFTVVPAGFISYMPVGLLRETDWPYIGLLLAGVAAMGAVSLLLFHRGLLRYSSGNRMGVRR